MSGHALAERGERTLRERLTSAVLAAPPLLLVGFLLAFPLVWVVVQSFGMYAEGGFTTEHYGRIFTSSFSRNSIWVTIYMSVVVTVICAVVAYPISYLLSRSRPALQMAGLFFILTPLMVGVVVRTYGWLVMFSVNGPVNSFLEWMSLDPVRLIGTRPALLIAMTDSVLPMMVLPLFAAMNKIPVATEEAAAAHGAGPMTTFFRVIIPMSRPGLASGSVLVFALAMSTLVTPAALGPIHEKFMSQLIRASMLTTLDWPYGSALAVVLLVLTAVICAVLLNILGPRTPRRKVQR